MYLKLFQDVTAEDNSSLCINIEKKMMIVKWLSMILNRETQTPYYMTIVMKNIPTNYYVLISVPNVTLFVFTAMVT